MMSVVNGYIQKLENIKANLPKLAQDIVRDNSDYIMYLLKVEQLGKGIKSDGTLAGRYKYSTTQYAKDPFNKPRKQKIKGQPFNFEWKGTWLDQMVLKSQADGFSIFSKDGKQRLLESIYGKLTKLTEKHNKMVNEDLILPKLYEQILKGLI